MQISITHDLKRLTADLNRMQKKQIPFAASLALNNTAKKVKAAQEREIKRVFDRPTRFTQKALYIKASTKKDLESLVKIKDEAVKGNPASKYLSAQIAGGARRHKGFEKLLIAKGQMPGNMYAIPTRILKKNQYGNVSYGLIQKILSGLGAQRDVYQRASKGSKTYEKYFSGIIGSMHGIWDVSRLHKGLPALLFIFVSGPPKYRKVYGFQKVAKKTINTVFKREFKKSLKLALATAR